MALSSCLLQSQFGTSFRMNGPRSPDVRTGSNISITKLSGHHHPTLAAKGMNSFLRGLTGAVGRPLHWRSCRSRRGSAATHASWVQPSAQIASSAFTWGTVAVLPFYTFMVVAPRAELTKKVAASSVPYVLLGTLYAYLLYLSWTPDTIRLMFASTYWLPELPGIATMFSSEMTLTSAWIHLLAVDLFAARQVYFEGLKESVETRHSVSLCLLFCPIGILAHLLTKAVAAAKRDRTEHGRGNRRW